MGVLCREVLVDGHKGKVEKGREVLFVWEIYRRFYFSLHVRLCLAQSSFEHSELQ